MTEQEIKEIRDHFGFGADVTDEEIMRHFNQSFFIANMRLKKAKRLFAKAVMRDFAKKKGAIGGELLKASQFLRERTHTEKTLEEDIIKTGSLLREKTTLLKQDIPKTQRFTVDLTARTNQIK